jgi:hypothetical protein
MAEGLWAVEHCSDKVKDEMNTLVEGTKSDRDILDTLDKEIASYREAPDSETVRNWARIASGVGNKFRKLHLRLEAKVKNEEANRFVRILLECEEKGIKFVATTANQDATNYVSEIRRTRNLFQGYVEAADNVISICRLHLGNYIASITSDVSS